jgi:hypothetical protein
MRLTWCWVQERNLYFSGHHTITAAQLGEVTRVVIQSATLHLTSSLKWSANIIIKGRRARGRQEVVSTISHNLDMARWPLIYTLVGHEIHKSRQNAPLSADPLLNSILLQKFSRPTFIIASIVTT